MTSIVDSIRVRHYGGFGTGEKITHDNQSSLSSTLKKLENIFTQTMIRYSPHGGSNMAAYRRRGLVLQFAHRLGLLDSVGTTSHRVWAELQGYISSLSPGLRAKRLGNSLVLSNDTKKLTTALAEDLYRLRIDLDDIVHKGIANQSMEWLLSHPMYCKNDPTVRM